ncbi:hypothetical protein Q1695_006279 [Nippostrongylus brasiliensis]|nr:hypothetical protein Q1695_006279 [Nippostrongylus brasiliensis]
MLPNEHFQKLLYDLFCLWHGVQRHYDPPFTDSEEQRLAKVKTMICKLLTEIDGRVLRIQQNQTGGMKGQDFYEEWTMLTWNVLCITSRLQNNLSSQNVISNDDKVIYQRLNQALVELVNYSNVNMPFMGYYQDTDFEVLRQNTERTLQELYLLTRRLSLAPFHSPSETETFRLECIEFGERFLGPSIEHLKAFCNTHSVARWRDVRAAQIVRMRDQLSELDESVTNLVAFYSIMMYILAVLAARLQGLRYEINMVKKVYELDEQVKVLSQVVFGALELLMSDCVLATEPSTSAILVTNNLFSMNCGALARGVVFKDFEIQVVSEETAEHIQSEMNRARLLQQPNKISQPPSAALLAMKPTSGTKRSNAVSNGERGFVDAVGNTAHKKSDVNSKEYVTIYPVYNAKYRYWQATYPHLLCTTRQKGRQSTHNSFQDLSPSNPSSDKSNGKRPIFYFHIKATMFSPSGSFATAHNLSLPFTIATRRNQDCQVQRMMSSYTATIFWLYGCNHQEGLLLQWVDTGMHWEQFKHLYKQHFKVNAGVQRGLIDDDFELLKYKLQCPDCQSGEDGATVNGIQQIVTFKNVLCPHLRYECGSTNVRFSVWRGMLELLQIFHDTRNNVRKLWEMGLLLGFLEFDEGDKLLEHHKSALIMRLSFVTGGTICFTVKSMAHTLDHRATRPIHLEPLDLKKLQTKCLKDYLRDIADAEKVKYILNASHQVVRITEVLAQLGEGEVAGAEGSRDISSNVTHTGDIAAMQHIRFTAMRIAVVTCKVKPPSADQLEVDVESSARRISSVPPPNDDFLRELVQLASFHGKSKQEVLDVVESLSDDYFMRKSNGFPDTPTSSVISPQPSSVQPYASSSQLPSPVGSTTPLRYTPIYDKFEYVYPKGIRFPVGWTRRQRMKRQYRIAVIGAPACGKTALIRRFAFDEYTDAYDPTIEDRYKKTIIYKGKAAHLEILDTAGKELVSEMMQRYISSADAFMVLYSVGSRKSYEHALHLFHQIAQVRGVNSIARLLVAAKCDSEHREVSADEGNTLSAQLSCSFAEVSSRLSINVHEVFEELVSQLRYIESVGRDGQRRNKEYYPNTGNSLCCFL